MDERRKRKTTEFLVKWEKGGARADDNMWEPLEHVKEHLEARLRPRGGLAHQHEISVKRESAARSVSPGTVARSPRENIV